MIGRIPISRRLGFALFCIMLSSPGCSEDDRAPSSIGSGVHDLTMTSAGRTRTYRLFVPTGYTEDTPLPLMIVLHGGGATGAKMDTLTGFSALAEQEKFIVAFPDGCVDHHWADGRGTTQPEIQGVDDVRFIDDLIARISGDVAVDADRIYACGFSNGSMLSNLLGCELSSRLAAIGGAAGELPENVRDRLPSEPVGVVYFHGTADLLVPYDGGLVAGPYGGRVLSAGDLARFWVQADSADTIPSVTLLPDVDPEDGTRVVLYAFGNGGGGSKVHLYRVEHGGHTWPGRSQAGSVTRDVDATRLMWEFFKSQVR
jgi:polyhydroxybutyrate depolymerase